MSSVVFKQVERLQASARSRYINLQANEDLELISDWNLPIRYDTISLEAIYYCMAIIYLGRQKNVPVRLVLANKPHLMIMCLVDDKYILDIERRDIPIKRYLEDVENYKWLYISGPTKDIPWVKIIE